MKKLLKPSSSLYLLLVSILILTPGFYRNQWLAAGRMWFYEWRTFQEAMVVARIVESRTSGVFSYGGLLGFGCIESSCNWETFNLEQEYIIYTENGKFQSYSPYTSHPGLQGVFFSLFEQATDFSPSLNLRIFHGAVSLLSAFILGLFVLWLYRELGLLAGLSALLFMAFSEWMTLFSGNIFWNIWAFYLPFVISSLYLMNVSRKENYDQRLFGAILALTILIKCLFTGFEYITTALAMPLMPFLFYAMRDSWGWDKFLKRTLHASISLVVGTTMGLLTLVWQLTQVADVSGAITTILDAFGKRSIGDPTKYISEAESLTAGFFPVLISYIKGRAILIRQILPFENVSIEISYSSIFILFLIFSLMLILIVLRKSTAPDIRLTGNALLLTAWASIAAPLSWFILFKAHSFVHTQMNYIIWQMPFTLYGFALCGYALSLAIGMIGKKKHHSEIQAYQQPTS